MYLVLTDRTVDLHARRVSTDTGTSMLTPREADVLACLLKHQGETVSRDTLLAEVWGIHRPVVTRCVDTAIRRVRVRIEADPSAPRHLLSVPGEGYRFDPQGPDPSADTLRPEAQARLLAALQAHPRVHVVGPPGCDARGFVAAAAASRGWEIGVDLHIVEGDAPDTPAVVLGPAPPGAAVVPLGPLPDSTARALLLRRCQRLGLVGDAHLQAILGRCDPQPEPLRRVADWLQTAEPDTVLQRLDRPLDAFPALADAQARLWGALSEPGRIALTHLAAVEGPVPHRAVRDVLGLTSPAIDALLRAGLVHEDEGHLILSRLTRAWTRRHHPAPDVRRAWAGWFARDWIARIRTARAEGAPRPTPTDRALSAALEHTLHEDPHAAALLCRGLDAVYGHTGHPPEVLRAFDRTLDSDLDAGDRSVLLFLRGTARRRAGDPRAALDDYNAALKAASTPAERALALAWRGTVHQVLRQWEAARDDLLAALDGPLEPRQRIATETALAVIEAQLGDLDDARERGRRAMLEARGVGHAWLDLLADRCMGTILTLAGDTFEARPRLSRAEARAAALDARRPRALCLLDRARAALEDGDRSAALDDLEQASDLADSAGEGWLEAQITELRALAAWADGDPASARTWLERALLLRMDTDPATAGVVLGWLAVLATQAGDSERATRLWRRGQPCRWPGPLQTALREAFSASVAGAPPTKAPTPAAWAHRQLLRLTRT